MLSSEENAKPKLDTRQRQQIIVRKVRVVCRLQSVLQAEITGTGILSLFEEYETRRVSEDTAKQILAHTAGFQWTAA